MERDCKFSGQYSAISGQPSAVSSQHSAVSNQRSAVSGQQSAFSNQHSAVSGQRSAKDLTVTDAKAARKIQMELRSSFGVLCDLCDLCGKQVLSDC
jgi:hypothetical protein